MSEESTQQISSSMSQNAARVSTPQKGNKRQHSAGRQHAAKGRIKPLVLFVRGCPNSPQFFTQFSTETLSQPCAIPLPCEPNPLTERRLPRRTTNMACARGRPFANTSRDVSQCFAICSLKPKKFPSKDREARRLRSPSRLLFPQSHTQA